MVKPKFKVGDRVIQKDNTGSYFHYNNEYTEGTSVVTIAVISENKYRNVYGIKECKCGTCQKIGGYAHWTNMEENFKLAKPKPKKKKIKEVIDKRYFASIAKKIA